MNDECRSKVEKAYFTWLWQSVLILLVMAGFFGIAAGNFARYADQGVMAWMVMASICISLGVVDYSRRRIGSVDALVSVTVALLVCALLVAQVQALVSFAHMLFSWLLSPGELERKVAVAAALTLYSGFTLFFVRLRWRGVYGLSEIAAGVIVGGARFVLDGGADHRVLFLTILTAGVYLVVRGLDNMHQGLTKDPIDPVATWFFNRFLVVPDEQDQDVEGLRPWSAGSRVRQALRSKRND